MENISKKQKEEIFKVIEQLVFKGVIILDTDKINNFIKKKGDNYEKSI